MFKLDLSKLNQIFIVIISLIILISCSEKKQEPIIITKTDTVYINKNDNTAPTQIPNQTQNQAQNLTQNQQAQNNQIQQKLGQSGVNGIENKAQIKDNRLPYDYRTEEKPPKDAPNPYANANLSYKIINSEGGTFGYEILIDDTPIIHQPNIPGMPGNKGFKTKAQAEKITTLILHKIKNNIMPPTVSTEELDSLGLLK